MAFVAGAARPASTGNFAFQYDEMGNLKAIVAVTAPPLQTASPQFSPANGPLICGQAVIVTDSDPAAAIYYTTDGSAPTTSSTRYNAPIRVTHSETITAFAADPQSGAASSQSVQQTYVCTAAPPPAAPVFSPTPTTLGTCTVHPPVPPVCTHDNPVYDCPVAVTISDTSRNVMINFTTDGTPPVPGNTPGFSSPLYTGPIAVAGHQVTRIRAVASQLDPSQRYLKFPIQPS
jgi:hypothetical protein